MSWPQPSATPRCATHLPSFPGGKRLIVLRFQDLAMSHAQISAKLGIPIQRVGPARDHCLGMLRRHPAVAALIGAEAGSRS